MYMKKTPAQQLSQLVISTDLSYNEEGKAQFHRLGKKVLKEVAAKMGLTPGSFDIRSNMGGIAVSGEVTLHGEHIYIQLSQGSFYKMFMYRHCNGRQDYSGGRNRWMNFLELIDMDKAVIAFKDAEQTK